MPWHSKIRELLEGIWNYKIYIKIDLRRHVIPKGILWGLLILIGNPHIVPNGTTLHIVPIGIIIHFVSNGTIKLKDFCFNQPNITPLGV